MDSREYIELFYSRSYEEDVNKKILDDKNYVVPRQQLYNYVKNLISIPYADFIRHIKENHKKPSPDDSGTTQFSSFSSCEIEMCNALLWANNPGLQFLEIGQLFPEKVSSKKTAAYRKFGENQIKTATQLGLTFEYYDHWYLGCLGYIYPTLNDEEKQSLLARTITRNDFYSHLLINVIDHNIVISDYLNHLSSTTQKRREGNVLMMIQICINECIRSGIKVFRAVRNADELNKPTASYRYDEGSFKTIGEGLIAADSNVTEYGTRKTTKGEKFYYIVVDGCTAKARRDGRKFIVLKGSEISTRIPYYSLSKEKERLEYLRSNATKRDKKYITKRDLEFPTPRDAAFFCAGSLSKKVAWEIRYENRALVSSEPEPESDPELKTKGLQVEDNAIPEVGLFFIKAKGLVAVGRFSGDKFIVLKGSELNPTNAPSYSESLKREQLLQLFASHSYNKYILSRDVSFSSPSSAAAFCLGRSANGWIEWKDQHGHDLNTYRKPDNGPAESKDVNEKPSHSNVVSISETNSPQPLNESSPSLGNKDQEVNKVKNSRTVTYILEDDDKTKERKTERKPLNQIQPEKKHSDIKSKSGVDRFIDEFIRMRTATKNGIKSPHKAVLLITILKLIGLRIYTTNHIAFDDLLIIEFGRYWDKLVPKDSPFNKNVCHPFIHLSSDSFFHLNLKNRITDINANWHIDSIREVCNYAFLDEDLYALAQVEESRMKLINFLIGSFGLNNLSSSDSSRMSRPVTAINERRIEPIKRAPIKTYGNDVRCTPESFARYLSSVKNKRGKPFSKSSISVYVGATRGDYMREVLSRFSETDNLYAITDINTLKKVLNYIENDDFKSNSKTPLFALRLYIRYIEELPTSNTRESVKYWIKSNNVQDFRLDDWMQNHDEVPWRRTNIFEVGDIVFMYTSLPVQRLTYVFRVEKLDVTPPAEMSLYWGDKRKANMPIQHDLLKLIQRIPGDRKLSLLDLQLHGAYGRLQGGRIISGKLLEYILGEIAKSDSTSAITPAKTIPQVESQQSSHDKKETRQYWLFSWNEKKFLLHDFFRRYQYIDWNNKHNNHLCVDDIVFLYCSQPESTIRYVAEVTEINVPVSESFDDSEFSLTPPMPVTYKYCTRLKLIKRVRSPKLDFHKLEQYGLNGSIQSPRKPNKQLLNYILSVIGVID